MFVIGTAGHIDHGKSVLIQALTGIDPDRLREEKERGMTIDLGFAWFTSPAGREIGVVDVPGHERFIKNMLAGVGGIDLALLVVAASEGVMPQTREHLAILDMLEVRNGIVVLTKKDLVDDEILALVRLEVEEALGGTSLEGAPMVAVSALKGEGLPELLAAIDKILDNTEPRRDSGRPRLPVDRVFTIAGAGTVVTGTLIDGSLGVGQEVEIIPSKIKSRIRGLQTHKSREDKAEPGSRVAANLVGVTKAEVRRGDVITTRGWLMPTDMITVRLRMISYLLRPLKHGVAVSFHTGSAEAMGKIRLLEGDQMEPGETSWAQIMLDEKVAVASGDRYIIRSTMETLGGGEVLDIHPKRLRRNRDEVIQNLNARGNRSAADALIAALEVKQPLDEAALVAESGMAEDEARALLETLVSQGRIIAAGNGKTALLWTDFGWKKISDKAVETIGEYHKKYPVRSGIPKMELVNRLRLGNSSGAVLQKLTEEGIVAANANRFRLPDFEICLSLEQQAKTNSFLKALQDNPYAPPFDVLLEPDLLNLLAQQGKVVKVSEQVVFAADAYGNMAAKVSEHLKAEGKISLAEVRDMFGTSRKYAQALLEYLDGKKVTRRVGDERVLY